MIQQLDRYRTPPAWQPGAPLPVRTLWFCAGAPLLSARWLPGSAWRVLLLRAFGARIGSGSRLKPGLRVKFPWRLQVGHHCWLAEDAWLNNLAPISLGDRVCLSQGTYLCNGNHNFRSPGFNMHLAPITIGPMPGSPQAPCSPPGTVIGAGVVVALSAVVSGTVLPGAIVRGNPAVMVR